MRTSALMLGSLVVLGCGATGPSVDFPWSVGSGWTATPMDGALARSASGCRVRVSWSEDGRPTDVSERYPSGGGGLTITRRPDGSVSARARVQRDDAALEASLELPRGGASMDEQALLTYMARPYDARLPPEAQLVRTYEVVRGDGRFTLQERGAREPSHTERYEADEGREHLSRTWSASTRTEGRAVMSGRSRLLETSTRVRQDVAERHHLPAESRRIVTEVLDEAGEIVVERETAASDSWSGSWEVRLERDDLGRTIVTDSRSDDRWSVVRRVEAEGDTLELTHQGCTSRLRHDRAGRLLSRGTTVSRDALPSARCVADRFEVTRDAEGRPVRADTIGAREDRRGTVTFLYDAEGRPVQLNAIQATQRREVRAVYAASGLLISENDEWSLTDERPRCEPPECTLFEHAVASSRHLERSFDADGRLVRSSVTRRETVVSADGSTETERRSVVDYAYESCAAESMTAEVGHEALLESPIEPL